MLSGQHEVCATSCAAARARALTLAERGEGAVGLVLEWKRAAISTGRRLDGDLLE
jgi:hypothetical protein